MRPYPYAIKSLNSTYFVFGFLWAALWLSLNAESAIKDDHLFASLHGYRLVFPYCAAGFSIIWLCRLKIIPKIQIWQTGALGYVGTVLIVSKIAGLDSGYLHFHAAMACAVLITILGNGLVQKTKEINETSLILVIALTGYIILATVFIVFFVRDVVQAFNHDIVRGYDISAIVPYQFGIQTPRPTGIARSATVIGLVSIFLYSFRILPSRYLYITACICMAALVYYQARGSIVALTITACFVFCLLPPTRIPSLRQSFLFLGISAGILFALWGLIYLSIFIKVSAIAQNSLNESSVIRNFFEEGNFTSGRLGHWVNGMNAFLNSPLFGLGGQADRLHINHNVSNMLIYVLMCGGVIGLIFASFCVFKPLAFIWMRLRYKADGELSSKDGFILCSISIFVFLSVRGLFENSYSLFNIDFLLAVPVIWHLSLCYDMKRHNKLRRNLVDKGARER